MTRVSRYGLGTVKTAASIGAFVVTLSNSISLSRRWRTSCASPSSSPPGLGNPEIQLRQRLADLLPLRHHEQLRACRVACSCRAGRCRRCVGAHRRRSARSTSARDPVRRRCRVRRLTLTDGQSVVIHLPSMTTLAVRRIRVVERHSRRALDVQQAALDDRTFEQRRRRRLDEACRQRPEILVERLSAPIEIDRTSTATCRCARRASAMPQARPPATCTDQRARVSQRAESDSPARSCMAIRW